MKKLKYILLIPWCLGVLYWFWILITNVDLSNDSFKRNHYKQKLEGMREFQCLCELFEGKQFKGTILSFEKHSKGVPDIIKIELDKESDSIFFKNTYIYSYLGHTHYYTKNGILTLKIGTGKSPEKIKRGDKVSKSSTSRDIIFESLYGQKTLNPYYRFESRFMNCTDLDTMNVAYNFGQYLKYDSLSRVSHPLNPNAIDYMMNRMEEQSILRTK